MTTSTPLHFRKSSYSTARGDNCVEVADLPAAAAVRDTQNREAGHLTFGAAEWAALVSTAQHHGGTSRLNFCVSSYSQGTTENCVGVADLANGAAVKDTQNPHIPHVVIGGGPEWRAFLATASRGL